MRMHLFRFKKTLPESFMTLANRENRFWKNSKTASGPSKRRLPMPGKPAPLFNTSVMWRKPPFVVLKQLLSTMSEERRQKPPSAMVLKDRTNRINDSSDMPPKLPIDARMIPSLKKEVVRPSPPFKTPMRITNDRPTPRLLEAIPNSSSMQAIRMTDVNSNVITEVSNNSSRLKITFKSLNGKSTPEHPKTGWDLKRSPIPSPENSFRMCVRR
mmetsp:Transcript_113154/g.326923  ORF Transcript_113154/g.326923 Transcript_113154/m.326923 type:complete len:213 (-) Transcript_113154:89-727(-)